MVLKEEEAKQIVNFVKKEPRTIQEIAKLLGKSWLTAASYVQQVKEKTGLLELKTFRKGTQGALKLVFYNHSDSLLTDDVKENLWAMIKTSRTKEDFDFLDVFQYVPEEKKKCFLEEYNDENLSTKQNLVSLLSQAERQVYCFSGNLSFLNLIEKKIKILEIIEKMLQRGVRFKILCRINLASINNVTRLARLMKQYPNLIEIRHAYHPLRGFIIDDRIARFKNEENPETYKPGELPHKMRIFYEIYDLEWVTWLQKVFWNQFKLAVDYQARIKELKKLY